MLHKLTSCCHVLEELVLKNVYSDIWNRSVSSNTLKRLTLWCIQNNKNPDCVSFDTPNLDFLKYSDYVAVKYPKVNFGSLVEASIDLVMTNELIFSWEYAMFSTLSYLRKASISDFCMKCSYFLL